MQTNKGYLSRLIELENVETNNKQLMQTQVETTCFPTNNRSIANPRSSLVGQSRVVAQNWKTEQKAEGERADRPPCGLGNIVFQFEMSISARQCLARVTHPLLNLNMTVKKQA